MTWILGCAVMETASQSVQTKQNAKDKQTQINNIEQNTSKNLTPALCAMAPDTVKVVTFIKQLLKQIVLQSHNIR
eukprot:5389692-Amphidinium_carterae.1